MKNHNNYSSPNLEKIGPKNKKPGGTVYLKKNKTKLKLPGKNLPHKKKKLLKK